MGSTQGRAHRDAAAAAAATYSLANPGCPLRELSRALDDHSETGMGTQGLRPCSEALSEGH